MLDPLPVICPITSPGINSSPSFIQTDNGPLVVFGSDDGYLHGVYSNGSTPYGWPIYEILEKEFGINTYSYLPEIDN